MQKEKRRNFYVALGMLLLFALWTVAVCRIDVAAIGPHGSAVGFATVNRFFHSLTGVHMPLYVITDWMGLLPVGLGLGFAVLGLSQWIRRGSILRVDYSLLVLGGFYVAVAVAYLFFEAVAVNYRPVLIAGVLEASYPSSTTLLVLCVIPTAVMQLNARIRSRTVRRCVALLLSAVAAFTVVARLLSGVHWLTDIVGGTLLSAGLVALYRAFVRLAPK